MDKVKEKSSSSSTGGGGGGAFETAKRSGFLCQVKSV